jgi:hypothetical protein
MSNNKSILEKAKLQETGMLRPNRTVRMVSSFDNLTAAENPTQWEYMLKLQLYSTFWSTEESLHLARQLADIRHRMDALRFAIHQQDAVDANRILNEIEEIITP